MKRILILSLALLLFSCEDENAGDEPQIPENND